MKLRYFLMVAALVALAACGNKKEQQQLRQQIEEKQALLSMVDIASEDQEATDLVQLYVKYADEFPSDSIVPIYLMRAADMSGNMGDTDEAIEYLDRIIEDYSDFEDIAMCYFLKGHFYELAGSYDDARAAYNAYLELFPDHYLAADTRKMLPNVGLSSEELFNLLMQQANDSNIAAASETAVASGKKQ
ncbi:MAG: tetratricopeptide repeat protein [Bacteroidales bacterium]|nr:tetratricopeptide repeat protein [Bacteroidales bacterium]